MTARLTVVIPTRADGRGLDRAIASVLGQQGVDVAVVVVLDGTRATSSVDDEALRGLVAAGHQVVAPGHQGRPGPLRNLGLALSATPYVGFLDDDDAWAPTKAATQVAALDAAPELVLVGTDARVVLPSGPRGTYFEGSAPSVVRLREEIDTNWLITSSVVTRTRSLVRVGGFGLAPDMRFFDDYVAWLKLLTLGEGMMVQEALVDYASGNEASLSASDPQAGRTVRRHALEHFLADAADLDLAISRRDRRRIARHLRP